MHQSRYRSAQTLSAQIPLYPPLRKGEKIGPEGLIASLIPGAARILWPSPPAQLPVLTSNTVALPWRERGEKLAGLAGLYRISHQPKQGYPPFRKGGRGGI